MSLLQQQASLAILSMHGQAGGASITGTSKVEPDQGHYFIALTAMTDTVIAAQEDVAGATNPDLTQFTAIPAGATVYGKFASITLTSGEMIGYYART